MGFSTVESRNEIGFRLRRPWLAIVALASLYTLLNAFKPLVIDDAAYYYYAVQAAAKPLDPYGFQVFWWERPEPANDVLAPMGLPYWWSLGIRLFGDRPFLWKLWLLPYSALLASALYSLFRRFAGRYELTLVAFTLFSPALLPSLNLMLDVPALALGLGAIALYLRAADDSSWPLALLAGVFAGLAMETKYTGFLAPAAILLHALLFRRLPLGLLAAVAAAVLFTGWEGFLTWRYGESHFLYHLRANRETLLKKAHLIIPFFGILGTLSQAGTLLAFAALGCRRWFLLPLGVLSGLTYLSVASIDAVSETWFTVRPFTRPGEPLIGTWRLEDVTFVLTGLLVCGVCVLLCWRLFFRRRLELRSARRAWVFLILWLALEIAGYFALTPFAAVRRLLGVTTVGNLLLGVLVARTCRHRGGRVHAIAAYGIALGLCFYTVDMVEAFTEKNAAEQAAAFIQARDDQPTIWYVGHWGFQHYAERQGMRPIVSRDRQPRRDDSLLAIGDWLVVPDAGLTQQAFRIEQDKVRQVGEVRCEDGVPLRTVICFYSGRTALTHLDGPRLIVRIYRVTAEHVASAP